MNITSLKNLILEPFENRRIERWINNDLENIFSYTKGIKKFKAKNGNKAFIVEDAHYTRQYQNTKRGKFNESIRTFYTYGILKDKNQVVKKKHTYHYEADKGYTGINTQTCYYDFFGNKINSKNHSSIVQYKNFKPYKVIKTDNQGNITEKIIDIK